MRLLGDVRVADAEELDKEKESCNGRSATSASPDKDNLEKALLDAALDDGSKVWDGRVTTLWGETGAIILQTEVQ